MAFFDGFVIALSRWLVVAFDGFVDSCYSSCFDGCFDGSLAFVMAFFTMAFSQWLVSAMACVRNGFFASNGFGGSVAMALGIRGNGFSATAAIAFCDSFRSGLRAMA